jgi:hypothetical protein
MADMQSRDLLDDGFPIRIQWGKRQATAGKLHPSNHRKHKKKVSWMWSLTSFRDASASDDSANSAATAATAPTAHAAASCHGIHAAAAADRRAPADAGPRTNGRPSSDGHPAVDGHDPAHGNATSSPSWRATRAAATRTRKRGMCYTSFSLSLSVYIFFCSDVPVRRPSLNSNPRIHSSTRRKGPLHLLYGFVSLFFFFFLRIL